jgi:hypothetical protein
MMNKMMNKMLHNFIAFIVFIVFIALTIALYKYYINYFGYYYEASLVEHMNNNNNNGNGSNDKCTPCDQEEDGSGRKKKKRRGQDGGDVGDEVEEELIEDSISPSDPNYANIKTMKEQRMVQRTTMLGSLKKEFDSLFLTPVASFCEHNKTNGSALQAQCSALTYDNCNSTSCCVWASGSSQIGKCTAGDAKGAMYKSDSNGDPVNVDTYYYQNKCIGPDCPLAKMIKMTRMKKMMSQQ